MIKNIYLIRHGQSHGNVDRKAYELFPDYAIRLTKVGAEQARKAGEILNKVEGNFHVFLSSYFRTRQTLDYLTQTLGEERILSRAESCNLREQEWNGLRLSPYDNDAEVFRNGVGSYYYRFDNAESGADVFNRVVLFHELFARPLMEKEDGNLLIVTHGFAMRVYLKYLLGQTVEEFEMVRNAKNAEIFHLQLNDETGGFELKTDLNIRPKRTSRFHYDKNDLA